MTFQLKRMGPFRIEKSEEYISGGQDNSYAEMVRVKGSKPGLPPFTVPSHLFKHSETELGLYLHDRKNLWRSLAKILGLKIEISDHEIMVHFPISLFPKIAEIVPFVKKRSRKTPLTDQERKRASRLRSYRKDIMRQNDTKTGLMDMRGPITLDAFNGNEIIGEIK